MGRMGTIKWEKSSMVRPNHNIISSDFPKYVPQPWKFMEGPAYMPYVLSNEYQRMWLEEREGWKKRMYPENTMVNVDIVKKYVLTFKNMHKPPKPEKKKPFKMKKFEGMKSKTQNSRPPGDKAMAFEKKKGAKAKPVKQEPAEGLPVTKEAEPETQPKLKAPLPTAAPASATKDCICSCVCNLLNQSKS